MLDPVNDLLPPPSSPTISSVSSSDLDTEVCTLPYFHIPESNFPIQFLNTESTGSFFHDRSTTLGTLMGVSFPAITFRAPSLRRNESAATTASSARAQPRKRGLAAAAFGSEVRRRRKWRWWRMCRDGDAKPASLGEFLEVERRFGDAALFGDATELEGVMGSHQTRDGRLLFADGRVLPPAADDEGTPATTLCRFPISLPGICSGGAG